MAQLSIPLTGISAGDVVPGTMVEIVFAAGSGSGGGLAQNVLLLGNRTSVGSAAVETLYGPDTAVQLTTQAEADTLFGARSELARMFKVFTSVNKDTPLYAMAVAESGGTAATGTVTIATTATANGSVRVYVGEEFAEASIANGDTATAIAASLVTAINAKTDWPVTASNIAGVITLTAALKGPRGNLWRYSGQIYGSVSSTVSPTATTAMSGGATADSSTNALAAIISRRFSYVVSAAEDAAQVGALATQLTTQALPSVGFRQACVFGSADTLANTITITTGRNAVVAECVWLQNSDVVPSELAARATAIYTLNEANLTSPRGLNFNLYGQKAGEEAFWTVKAPRAGTVPSRATLKSALENGITPIQVDGQKTYITKRITTRCLNGAVPDFRIRDAHKRTICYRFADELFVKGTLQLTGKSIGDDPPAGAPAPPRNVATPRSVRPMINQLLQDYAANGLIENVDKTIADTIVQREAASPTRMMTRIPLDPIDVLDQAGFVVDQL